MSKKRQRDRQAATAAPALDRRSAADVATVPSPASPAPASRGTKSDQPRTWFENQVLAWSRALGSLEAAIALAFTFIIVLAAGTMLESWYSARIAQELIYRTWWFSVLLILLAVNIFFAAAKKWPWKKHQTGFLITHVGLLTMLAGGILNSVGGVDAQMVLLDSDKAAVSQRVLERYGQIPNASGAIYEQERSKISVTRGSGATREFDFSSGSFPWGDDRFDGQVPLGLSLLDLLAHPWPRSWRRDLGDGAQLEVLAFYPHARREPFSAARPGEAAFPAVKVLLDTPHGMTFTAWVALNPRAPSQATENQFPSRIEILGHCPTRMLDEFLRPPEPAQLGAKGQLVFLVGTEKVRLDVDSALGKLSPLPGGWQVQLDRYDHADRIEGAFTQPLDPVVHFTLIDPKGTRSQWRWSYRAMTECGPYVESGTEPGRYKTVPAPPGAPAVWDHPPDYRVGATDLRGLLQFVIDEQDRLHYRSLTESGGAFRLEAGGAVEAAGDPVELWRGMKWKFQVAELLPRAVEEVRFIPVAARPGLERRGGGDVPSPVISCPLTLAAAAKAGKSETLPRDFQLVEGAARNVTLQGRVDGQTIRETFRVEYSYQRRDLEFELRLQRFEMQVDRGTNKPATYTSFVQLLDRGQGIHGANHVITMNQPLNHRGYKVYQSDYKFLLYDEVGRPVYYSGFTVGRDPGLWLKYLGSAMLALGITCMFYMKAYFFAPRRRPTETAAAGA